jgi:hypothetical protein
VAAPAVAQLQQGGIKATVVNAAGKAVSGLYVSAVPLGPNAGATRTETSDAKGEAEFARLRPGFYRLCLNLPRSAYLDPCVWSKPLEIAVWQAQISAAKLTVDIGSILRVRVDDDSAKKYLENAKSLGGGLSLGILMGNGTTHLLHPFVAEANGRTYETAIPVDKSLQLAIYTGHVQLRDAKGATVAESTEGKEAGRPALLPVRHNSGQANPDVKLTAVGVK